VVDRIEVDPCLCEAITDRFARKAGPVLDPAKTFLLHGRYHSAVRDEARGRVAVVAIYPKHISHALSLIIF
jgi:hypothetical protein